MALSIDRSLIGTEFDRCVFDPVSAADIRAYAEASGEPIREDGGLVAPVTFVLRLRGKGLTEKHGGDDGDRVECDLVLESAEGDRLVTGTATVALPLRG